MRHVAETAPFLAPPLDLDDNEHASRRISTPLITMGLLFIQKALGLLDRLGVKKSAFLKVGGLHITRNRSSAVDLLG